MSTKPNPLPFFALGAGIIGTFLISQSLQRKAFREYLEKNGRSEPHGGEEAAFYAGAKWKANSVSSRLRLANAADRYWKEILENCAKHVETTNPTASPIGKAVLVISLASSVTGPLGREKLQAPR